VGLNNPQRFDNNYFGRPLDPKTAECWKRFWRDVDAASKQNAQCAGALVADLSVRLGGQVRGLIAIGKASGVQACMAVFSPSEASPLARLIEDVRRFEEGEPASDDLAAMAPLSSAKSRRC
jgi:hypothetical protein